MEHLFRAVLVFLLALGYLHQVAILDILGQHAVCVHLSDAQLAENLVVHRVGQGTDGAHGRHRDVLHRADVEVGVGTHHRRVAAGAHCVREYHRVRVGLAALHVEHEVLHRGRAVVRDAVVASGGTIEYRGWGQITLHATKECLLLLAYRHAQHGAGCQ